MSDPSPPSDDSRGDHLESDLPKDRRHLSQLEFDQSRAAYESLVNSLPLSVLIKDTEGRRLFANRRYLDDRGIALDDLIGKTDADLFPPEIASQFTADDREVIETGKSLHDVEKSLRRDGSARWIERVKSPITDQHGKVIGVQLMFWDVTDKVSAEKLLKKERDLLTNLLRNIPDSIYFKDKDSRFLRISESMAEKFGLPDAASAEGKTDADIFSEEHAIAARKDEMAVMSTKEPLVDREEKETWRDREDTWCLSTKMPFLDEEGQVIGTFGISRNITELKKHRDDLRKARDAADRANRAKSDFLANMSHEIRTPMNAIVGMSELLSQTQLSEEQRDYVQLVCDSADSLLGLLNDILDFSKIEARRLELESIPFSIRDLVEKTGRTLSLRAAEKGLELACRVAPDVPERLIGDPGRLRQVMINLVGNGIKFTDEGEVVVEVCLGEREEGCPKELLPLHVSVRDTGIGVPKEKQRSILEAFTQADTSTTRRFGGTGLGLAISRQLVELMHGKLELESRLGYGSTFYFTGLFCKAPPLKEDRKLRLTELGHMPVLVVDDNSTNRRILKEILTAWQFEPQLAESGASALAAFDEAREHGKSFTLAILDCMMPEMDGFELAKRIRERCGADEVKLIILSSATHGDDIQRCKEIGISRYMTKPVVQSELLDTVLQVMGLEHKVINRAEDERPECPPLRVLVAEDGLANQHVAIGILRAAGHHAVVASDGREAIAKWKAEPFDLILMDMHMPVMDGIAATVQIRAIESSTGDHIPIIALTAAALKEDEEACERAGMDAYLSKPIHPRKLQNLLAEYAGKRERRQRPLTEPVGPSSTRETAGQEEPSSEPANSVAKMSELLAERFPDLPADMVDFRAAASRVPGGLKGVRRLAEVFVMECESILATLQHEIPNGDASVVQRAAHTMKGSANLFLAKRVQEIAKRIETKSRTSGISDLGDELEILEGELDRLLMVVRGFLDVTDEA